MKSLAEQEFYNFFSIRNFEKSRRFSSTYKYSPENLAQILAFYNHPQKEYKTIHIAGTSGKGSMASYIQRLLSASHFKTGLYGSPHFESLFERISINEKNISPKYFNKIFFEIKKNNLIKNLSFFDALTLIAFLYFQKKNVDWAVIETGLGGRLDSTNHLNSSASILTPIGMDHKDILGNTVEEIAKEKAGIIQPNSKVFVLPQQKSVKNIISMVAARKKAKVFFLDSINEPDYRKANLHYAKKIFISIFNMPAPKIDINLKGRFEIIGKSPTLIFDAAHNIIAVRALAVQIKNKFAKELIEGKIIIHINCMKERNIDDLANVFNEELGQTVASKIFLFQFEDSQFYSQGTRFVRPLKKTFAQFLEIEKNMIHIVAGSIRLYSVIKLA